MGFRLDKSFYNLAHSVEDSCALSSLIVDVNKTGLSLSQIIYIDGPNACVCRPILSPICVGRESLRVSEPGRCLGEDRDRGGGEALGSHLAVVESAV